MQQLPAGAGVLLQQVVRLDEDEWRGRLKPHPALDAQDSIAHVRVAANGEGRAQLIQLLNQRYWVHRFAIQRYRLSFFEGDFHALRILPLQLRRVGAFGQRLVRSQCFDAAHAGAPDAFINGVFSFLPAHFEALFLQVFNLGLARQFQVTDGREDFRFGRDDRKSHVETHLVVAGSGAAVRDVIGLVGAGVLGNGQRLEHALGAHAQRVSVVF